jgi:hypothetical protein
MRLFLEEYVVSYRLLDFVRCVGEESTGGHSFYHSVREYARRSGDRPCRAEYCDSGLAKRRGYRILRFAELHRWSVSGEDLQALIWSTGADRVGRWCRCNSQRSC